MLTISRIFKRCASSGEKTAYFGYQRVTEEQKSQQVSEVFANVAGQYDLMNDVSSLWIHRLWKDRFVRVLNPVPGMRILDTAGGTGDIAFRIVNYIDNLKSQSDLPNPILSSEGTALEPYVCVCDISKEMLSVGKDRALEAGLHHKVSWVCGDAENLPFDDNSFDAYTIAFGIRNVVHIDQAIQEAYRVLKRGGRFLCLEFSHVENPLFRMVYDNYSFQVIPVLGQLIVKDWKSYQYLVESIRMFPKQEEFKSMVQSSGFRHVTYENLTNGIAAIHSGFKL